MEAYITTEIEFSDFEEEVIMASSGTNGTVHNPIISPDNPTTPNITIHGITNFTNNTTIHGVFIHGITIHNGTTGGDSPIDEPIPVHTPIGPASLWYLPF